MKTRSSVRTRRIFSVTIFILLASVASSASAVIRLDLDPANTQGMRPGYAAIYTEDRGRVSMTAADAILDIPSGDAMIGLTATLTPVYPGDILRADTSGGGVIALFSDGRLTLSGDAPADQYQTVIRRITYESDSQNPSPDLRTLSCVVETSSGASDPVATRLAIVPVNDPPIIQLPRPLVTPMNLPVVFSRSNGKSIDIADIDAGLNPIATTLAVDQGILTVTPAGEARVHSNGTGRIVVTGTTVETNDTLEGMRYDPAPHWKGNVTLLVETTDNGYTGAPGPLHARETVGIAVVSTTDPNIPPVANPGDDRTVCEYMTVHLDGTRSYDPDGRITRYEWVQITGDAVSLDAPDSPSPGFVAPDVSPDTTLIFRLSVFDDLDAAASDTVTVTVTDLGEPSAVVEEGRTARLTAPETPSSGTSVQWRQLAGPSAPLSDSFSLTPCFVAPVVPATGGHLVFRMESVDTGGFETTLLVRIRDNGITGFPPDILTFRPVEDGSALGVQAIPPALTELYGVDPEDIPDSKNRPRAFPRGLIRVALTPLSPGDTAAVQFFLNETANPEWQWYRLDAGHGWISMENDAVFSLDRSVVTIKLTDGGPGDEDGTANGRISSLSGPGAPPSPPPVSPEEKGDDGDSGGCFMRVLY